MLAAECRAAGKGREGKENLRTNVPKMVDFLSGILYNKVIGRTALRSA